MRAALCPAASRARKPTAAQVLTVSSPRALPGAPCSFQGCSCTWAVAEAVWIQGMDTDGAKRYFQEAVDVR